VTEKNKLYYGDNLDVLRRYVKDESVDLIYLDLPFNSRQDYNVLFAEKDGTRASSQIKAFEDMLRVRPFHEVGLPRLGIRRGICKSGAEHGSILAVVVLIAERCGISTRGEYNLGAWSRPLLLSFCCWPLH